MLFLRSLFYLPSRSLKLHTLLHRTTQAGKERALAEVEDFVRMGFDQSTTLDDVRGMGKLDAEFFKKLSQRLVDLDQMSLSTVLSTLSYAKTVISDRFPRLECFSGSMQWYTELRANIEKTMVERCINECKLAVQKALPLSMKQISEIVRHHVSKGTSRGIQDG